MCDEPVAHEAAVHEKVLQVGPGARSLGLAHAAFDGQRPAHHLQLAAADREVGAQHLGAPLRGGGSAPLRHQTAFVPHRKAHVRPGQRVAAHGFERVRELGGVGLEKFAPCRGAEKQLLNLYGGAHRPGCSRELAAARTQAPGVPRTWRAAGQRDFGHRGNGCQGLTPKAHRRHRLQFGQRADLAGGVALQGQGQVFGGDARTIVLHHQRTHAAGHQTHSDLHGAGIQRVIHQLAHGGGRTVYDFARSDLADQFVGQFADAPAHVVRLGARLRRRCLGVHSPDCRSHLTSSDNQQRRWRGIGSQPRCRVRGQASFRAPRFQTWAEVAMVRSQPPRVAPCTGCD